jgi:hypothetical protein
VVEDHAEAIEVAAAELDADPLGDGVAERVWVAEPLALDDLDRLAIGRAFERTEQQVHGALSSPSNLVSGLRERSLA